MSTERRENVVALPGYSVPTAQGAPVKPVVDILREYLAKAENGEMRAVIVTGICGEGANERIDNDFAAAVGTSWSLLAALGRVTRRFEKWLDKP